MHKLLYVVGFIVVLIGIMAYVLINDSDNQSQSIEVGTENSDSLKRVHDSLIIVAKADSIIELSRELIGSPYKFSGISKDGFDCSGFTWYVFSQFGMDITRTSRSQAKAGKEVTYAQARKGDLIIFTGTNPAIRHPGHVGIITEKTGDQVKFIHSSSARRDSGVKISEVEGTAYKKRFMTVRRVLRISRSEKTSQTAEPAS